MPLREPLKWTGGTRQSASGLIVELAHRRGHRRHRRGAGPDAADDPARSSTRELPQFLVGQDPLRTRVARPPHGGVLPQLERHRRLRDRRRSRWRCSTSRARRSACRWPSCSAASAASEVPVVGYLFIDEPEANAQRAAEFVEAGHTELKLKVGRDLGQDHDTIAAIRDRVGTGRQAPDRREHELERPGRDQVDPRARAVRPAVRRAAGARLRPRRAWRRCGARSRPDRRRRELHDRALRARADQGRRVRRVRRLSRPRPAASRAPARSPRSRTPPASGARSAAGPSSASRRRPTPMSSPLLPNFAFASDTHYPLQTDDVLDEPARRWRTGRIAVPRAPGLGVALDPERRRASLTTSDPRIASSTTTSGRGSPGRSDPLTDLHERRDVPCPTTKHPTPRERASSAVASCSSRQAPSAPVRSWPARSPARPRRRAGALPRHRSAAAARSSGRSSRIPVHIAPFGAILTSNHWGKQADLRLARRVGPEPEPQARARRVVEDRRLEDDRLQPRARA